MSTRKPRAMQEQGFTVVELLVVISLVVIMFVSFAIFFSGYLSLYSKYQKDAGNFSTLAQQSQRISNVIRGIVDIISEDPYDLKAYAYFSPNDNYTSEVHYYLNPAKTALMVDVTAMTANAPIGTTIPATKRTYTIIPDFYSKPGVNLFNYYDLGGTQLIPPVANQRTIEKVEINLATPVTSNSNGQTITMAVSLRNRKVNL